MKKLTPILKDPKGREYYYCQLTFEEVKLSPWIFKELRPGLVDNLLEDMKERWILEPITCYEENGEIYLANGKHRYEAAKKHDDMLDQGLIDDQERWMKKLLEARVYVNLKPHEVPDLTMALDDVRKKAAAGERLVGLANQYVAIKTFLERDGQPASEEDILRGMGWVRIRMKYRKGKPVIPKSVATTVIVANHIHRIADSKSKLGTMIRARQIPRRKLEIEVQQGNYPLLTRENLAHALRHIIRQIPVSLAELNSGEDPRELEHRNLVKLLELLADKVIIPLAKGNLDQAVGICSRFPLEAVGLAIRDILIAAYQVPSDAPLATKEITDWQPYIQRIEKLKSVNWADPVLRSIRSAEDLYRGVGCPAISSYIFP
jgi:Ni,Fe-hydrogenase III component G/predicted nucleic acid-binding protein